MKKLLFAPAAATLSFSAVSLPAKADVDYMCQGKIEHGDKTGTVMVMGTGSHFCYFETDSVIGAKIMRACGLGIRCEVRVTLSQATTLLDDNSAHLVSVRRK
jgi:hypothetical protein